MELLIPEKNYKDKVKIVNKFVIIAIILIIINCIFLICITLYYTEYSVEYKKYKNLKTEYTKELAFNKEMIQSKKEALEKLKFAQDTWKQIQKRLS